MTSAAPGPAAQQPAARQPADRQSSDGAARADLILEQVRTAERRRVAAIRSNDAETIHDLLDPLFLYINSRGRIYDKSSYVAAIASHEITYAGDIELSETEHRVDEDLVVLAGTLLGHVRLDREAEVYHAPSMRVWRRRPSGWRLIAWQSSALW